jgi:hypothetical protein
MNHEKHAEFLKELGDFWLADARDTETAPLLLKYLRNQKAKLSEIEFKWLLADAILNERFSIEEYERLTDVDCVTKREVAADLAKLWRLMFGGEPIALPPQSVQG